MFGDVPRTYSTGGSGNSGIITPAEHNLIAWAFDPAAATGVYQPNSGVILLSRVQIVVATTVGKLYWHVAGGGTGPVAGQNEVGLYSSVGTKLASANIDSALTTGGVKATTITDQPVAAGFYWVGHVFNCSTATPFLAQGAAITSADTLINVGLSAATYRFARNGTGTALPASITPGSNVAQDHALWVAVGP